MQFIEESLEFLYSLSPWTIAAYFWPFFLIDMVRYVVSDIIICCVYFPRRYLSRERRVLARKALFKERPLVSVIVPGKNEGKHIPKLIQTLSLQTYKNTELIVVDDGSDDNTSEICRHLESIGKISCFIRNDVRGGKASAANTALYFSKGKYVVHLDADCYMEPDSIETILLPFYMDETIGAVGGDVRVANADSSMATHLQAVEYMKSITTGRTVSSQLGILRIIAGAHGAFRRDVLDQIYGWDVGPGLDGDITLKIRKIGYRVVHEPDAICYTNVPVSFTKLAKQRFRWDRSMVRFRVRKHRDVLMPSKSFRALNFIASAENIFFNLLLNFKWWIYLFQIMVFSSHWFEIIFIINYLLYMLTNVFQYAVACTLMRHKLSMKEFELFFFLPLMPLYTGVYLRIVRTYAYLMEFINGASYSDAWNPWKVSRIAKREHL